MIKKFLLFFITMLLAQISCAQQTQTSIPLRFDTGNPAPFGEPSTVITIQGKRMPILLDTGAEQSGLSLSPHALNHLKVKFTGKHKCFKAFDGKYCEKTFIIPEIKVGSFVVKNVKGITMSKPWGGNAEDFKETEASRNGVLGFSLLSKFNLLLDYPSSKAILIKRGEKPTDYDINKWIAIPFTGHLTTHLYLNGQLRTFSWDSGAVPSVIRKSATDKITPCPDDAPYSKKNCLSVESKQLSTEENVSLPNTYFKITNVPSYAPFDGLIGSNFYSENLVYFDFDKRLIFVNHATNDKVSM